MLPVKVAGPVVTQWVVQSPGAGAGELWSWISVVFRDKAWQVWFEPRLRQKCLSPAIRAMSIQHFR